ncbi:MBL fold metallo-hydrolase [Bacillus sp. FJAT-27225]|uniref:MBL fold metallo-hydrolase n=1 Tax=Bacillus sp. FJAT-27225 TaxID=1743144 RepID=UPI00080C3597|nr:MBL fold metallo-hydrolase [Bacillus sp. FJAT-27225]OCA83164.1 MBL fold metallo-hydrolase [Bacillus sp. FJAT-27225]
MLIKKYFSEKTANGVHMGNGTVSIKRFKMNVHSFFIDGVLIDTGSKSLEKYFKPFFSQLEIDKVVITHHHEDHTGGAAFLQKDFDLPLYMNRIKIGDCSEKADYPLYRQAFWGKRRPFHAEPLGGTFQSPYATWRVIESPGHAVDHVCFLNEETGQMFTGDLYCQEKTKVVLREESIPEIIQSLKKVLTYDFDDVFCCHAGYLRNGRTALKNKLEYLLNLQGTVLKMYYEGKTPEEINNTLFSKRYPIMFFSAGEWDSIHMVHSILKNQAASVS